jgi:hypothetical protein
VPLEAFKPIIGKWLPWAPGTLTVLVQHNTPQTPLVAPGEMSRLLLKSGDAISVDVESPQSGSYTFCRLRPKSYTIMAWVNDMLAINDCHADVNSGTMTSALCFITQPQAQLKIEVHERSSGRPITDVRVQIKSHKGHLWRGPVPVDENGRSPWEFLQRNSLCQKDNFIGVLAAHSAAAT